MIFHIFFVVFHDFFAFVGLLSVRHTRVGRPRGLVELARGLPGPGEAGGGSGEHRG